MIEGQRRGMQRLAPEAAQRADRAPRPQPRGRAKRPPYTGSPTSGYLRCARCRRIWWVRPGLELHSEIGMRAEALEHPVVRDAPGGRRCAPPCAAGRCDGGRSAHRRCPRRSSPRRRSRDTRARPRARGAARQCGMRLRACARRPAGRWCPCRADGRCRRAAAPRGPDPGRASAFCRVWRGLPAPGCTTRPAGLSITSTSSSSWTTSSGIASGEHLAIGRRSLDAHPDAGARPRPCRGACTAAARPALAPPRSSP